MECSICKDAIDVPTTGRVELSCSHQFHLSCIGTWFQTNNNCSCPMCRKPAEPLERIESAAPSLRVVGLEIFSADLEADDEEDWDEGWDEETLEAEDEDEEEITYSDLETLRVAFAATGADVKIILKREDIATLLQRQRSRATVEEFFNEEDSQSYTAVTSMTEASLNARLSSLGAVTLTPGEFEEIRWGLPITSTHPEVLAARRTAAIQGFPVIPMATSPMLAPVRRVLNPEEDALLGPVF